MFTLSTFQFVAFIYVYILIAPTQLLCAKIVLPIIVSIQLLRLLTQNKYIVQYIHYSSRNADKRYFCSE